MLTATWWWGGGIPCMPYSANMPKLSSAPSHCPWAAAAKGERP